MSLNKIIQDIYFLDLRATAKPWNHIEGDGSVWQDNEHNKCVANTDHCPNDNMDINAELIAYYRNNAPIVAKALGIALKHLLKKRDDDSLKCINEINSLLK